VMRRLLYPPTDVGPVGLSWVVAMPGAFRRLPDRIGARIAYRCIRPAASGWLVPRTAQSRFTLGSTIAEATLSGDALRLRLDDGTARVVDRVVLGTGFDIRVDRHPLFGPELAGALRTRDGAPLLRAGFESSVDGLHFVGAFAAATFGPVMRFVSGTPFTGTALGVHVHGRPRAVRAHAEPSSVAA